MYEDKDCSIELKEGIECLIWKVKGNLTNEAFINSVFIGVKYLKKKQVSRLVSSLVIDLKELETEKIKDMEWMFEEVISILYMNNVELKQVAIISAMNGIVDSMRQGLLEDQSLHFFNESNSGVAWVKQEYNKLTVASVAS